MCWKTQVCSSSSTFLTLHILLKAIYILYFYYYYLQIGALYPVFEMYTQISVSICGLYVALSIFTFG